MRRERRRSGGFTLVELVIVIVVGGVMAAALVVFFRPALDAFLASRQRAALVAEADGALQLVLQDVRSAVPNSIRAPSSSCFEVIPTTSGGRYRQGPDTVNDVAPGCSAAANCAGVLDPAQTGTTFDVLTPLSQVPAVGDWVVVDNQNPGDVYAGANRAALTAVATPDPKFGRHRLSVAAMPVPLGYDGGRFQVVPNAQRAVFYSCSGADGTLDASGNGKGQLLRRSSYGFNSTYPASCPAAAGADLVATHVVRCRFLYDPNQGATQQNGFVAVELELARGNERVSLVLGAHVENMP